MLTIKTIIESLPAHIVFLTENTEDILIQNIIAGDMMSDMLVSIESNVLLVTSLSNEQAIRTADIICASAILLVNDKLPTKKMKELAANSDISLLATPLPMYEACVALGNLELLNDR